MKLITNKEKNLLLAQLKALQNWMETTLDMNCICPVGDTFENLIIEVEGLEEVEE